MTSHRDPDDVLAAWLHENNAPLPAPTRRAIEVGTRAVPQWRRPVWLPRRVGSMASILSAPAARGVAAAAAVVVVAVVAAASLGMGLDGAESGVRASPSATALASPSPSGLQILEPGEHTTNFEPTLSFNVPAGWALIANTPENVTIVPAAFDSALLIVCKDPAPGDLRGEPVPGIGRSAKDLTDFLASREELGLMAPPADYQLGGLDGYWMDLKGPSYITEVNVIGTRETCGIQMYAGQRIRLAFLDAPDATVMILIWDTLGSDAFIEAGTSIVETFAFDAP